MRQEIYPLIRNKSAGLNSLHPIDGESGFDKGIEIFIDQPSQRMGNKMETHGKKTIGVLGGMGPAATALFFRKVIELTPAEKDQDHLKMIIYNDPTIPDRTNAILDNTESPVSKIREGLIFLENAGVDIIAIPCVSSHYYYEEFTASIRTPVLDIVTLTIEYIKYFHPSAANIGVLATMGAYKSKIIESKLKQFKLRAIIPDIEGQKNLMESIYGRNGIKSGCLTDYPKDTIVSVARELIQKNSDVILSGCTEISLVLNQEDLDVPVVDPLSILAVALISEAG